MVEPDCFKARVEHHGIQRSVLVYHGVPVSELTVVLQSAFTLGERDVVGLQDKAQDIFFPLSFLSRAPAYFSVRAPYRLVAGHLPEQAGAPTAAAVAATAAAATTAAATASAPAPAPAPSVRRQRVATPVAPPPGLVAGPLAAVESAAAATNGDTATVIPAAMRATLVDLRKETGLGEVLPQSCLAALKKMARRYSKGEGMISLETFSACIDNAAATRGRIPLPMALARRIFKMFNPNHRGLRGTAPLGRVAGGLTVLCGGTRLDKVRAAFHFYDTDEDGLLSEAEVAEFLSSVYCVIYGTAPDLAAAMGDMGPEELAAATAKQCMEEAGALGLAKIDLGNFENWYLQPPDEGTDLGQALASATDFLAKVSAEHNGDDCPDSAVELSLSDVQRLTRLQEHDVSTIFELFAACADGQGVISRPAFNGCFRALIEVHRGRPSTDEEREELMDLLDGLFAVFDADEDGASSLGELASGLGVLCGSEADEKVHAVFQLYDADGDGSISKREMVTCLTSTFKVLFAMDPARKAGVAPLTAKGLAIATTDQAFEEMDINEDGSLNYEEFKRWYNAASMAASLAEEEAQSGFTLPELQRLLGLREVHIDHVFSRLASTSDTHGFVTAEAFKLELGALAGLECLPLADRHRAEAIIARLYSVMDANGDGRLDFSELASGLSVLCGGSRNEKVLAAFNLYDVNGDGLISAEQMAGYLTAVFRVLNETSAVSLSSSQAIAAATAVGGRVAGSSIAAADELALLTVRKAFEEADADNDGRLTYEEFAAWCERSDALDPQSLSAMVKALVAETAPQAVRLLSLGEARRMAGLEKLSADEVFAAFSSAASELGHLDRSAFHRCFRALVRRGVGGAGEGSTRRRAAALADRLFDAFDVNGDGLVDFSELASGLSVLCGGSRDGRAKAAFGLFDLDGSGYITVAEMAAYLTSVFRVLYELQPDLREAIGASPELLGAVTAERAVAEADTDRDGRISFTEFRTWYGEAGILATSGSGANGVVAAAGVASAMPTWLGESSSAAMAGNSGAGVARVAAGSNTAVAAAATRNGGSSRNDSIPPPALVLPSSGAHGNARRLTRLDRFRMRDLHAVLTAAADSDGRLTRSAFFSCFETLADWADEADRAAGMWDPVEANIAGGSGNMGHKLKLRLLLGRIFDAMDRSDEGRASVLELSSGLSVLCGGSRDDKVRAAFELFDVDGDGCCSAAEMAAYLTNVFRVLYETTPGYEEGLGIDPASLADAVAMQAIEDAGGSHNGLITFQEFSRWYGHPEDLVGVAMDENSRRRRNRSAASHATVNGSAPAMAMAEPQPAISVYNSGTAAAVAAARRPQAGSGAREHQAAGGMFGGSADTMLRARQLLRLESFSVDDVLEAMSEAATNGVLGRDNFLRCMGYLWHLGRDYGGGEELDQAHALAGQLFDVFDIKRAGSVDFTSIAGGMSVLCAASLDEKISAAFVLHDADGDGEASFDQLAAYLASVFCMLGAVVAIAAGQRLPVGDPVGLALTTARQCYQEAGLPPSAKIGIAEFRHFVAQGVAGHGV